MKTIIAAIMLSIPALAVINGSDFSISNVSTSTAAWGTSTNSYPVNGSVVEINIKASTNMVLEIVTKEDFGTAWGGQKTALVSTAVSPGYTRITNATATRLYGDIFMIRHKSAANGTNTVVATIVTEE